MKLSDPVRYVKGVGVGMEKKLNRLSILTVEDLLSYYPREYQDWSRITAMDETEPGESQVIYGQILDVQDRCPRPRMSILTAVITDGRGVVSLVYFNQSWRRSTLKKGAHVLAYGKIEYAYRKLQMNSPETELIEPEELESAKHLMAVYPLTEGISMKMMRKIIGNALAAAHPVPENLPADVLSEFRLLGREEALFGMHMPSDREEQQRSRHRLAFEELFFMQAGILMLRDKRRSSVVGIKCAPSGSLVRDTATRLPFHLTNDQRRAFADIENDMEGMLPMQRLLQGDVGSGKTAVAALALAKITENGYQGALMAPTEVLAEQHMETLQKLYHGLPLQTELLTGRTKASEREQILKGLREGSVDVLIGTHALTEDPVVFRSLGLVITDEQHRFGVRQRMALETKGDSPHTLVMTATPIPRTMALSVYGDLDVSVIREMPPGRKPVKTYAVGSDMLSRLYVFMRREMKAGHQVYVVCPLVEESEKQDLKAAVSVYRQLQDTVFPDIACGIVYGSMKGSEKDEVMDRFRKGEVRLLVATSVIEVGVNVPNATIMLVHGADRFGLSQLHQLRGRVGRGQAQSYCILLTDSRNETVRLRMELMTKIQDGFLLAEKDLLIRGSGEFFGYHQHGLPDLKAANIISDLPILREAREAAGEELRKGVNFSDEIKRRFGSTFFEMLYH